MPKYSAKEMDKFREIASFLRGFDTTVRSGSSDDAINIVIGMVNRDRPVVESLLGVSDAPLVRLGQGDYTKDIH